MAGASLQVVSAGKPMVISKKNWKKTYKKLKNNKLRATAPIYRPESKFTTKLTDSNSPQFSSNMGYIENLLFFNALGDTNANRNGSRVNVVSVNVRGSVSIGSDYKTTLGKVLLIQDTDAVDGNQPDLDDIFSKNPAMIGTSLANQAYLNRSNLGRFKVMASKSFTLTSQKPEYQYNIYKKVNSIVSWTTDPIPQVNQNHYYLVVLTNRDNTLTEKSPVFNASRVKYYDS